MWQISLSFIPFLGIDQFHVRVSSLNNWVCEDNLTSTIINPQLSAISTTPLTQLERSGQRVPSSQRNNNRRIQDEGHENRDNHSEFIEKLAGMAGQPFAHSKGYRGRYAEECTYFSYR